MVTFGGVSKLGGIMDPHTPYVEPREGDRRTGR